MTTASRELMSDHTNDELQEQIHEIVNSITLTSVDQGYNGVKYMKTVIVGRKKVEEEILRLIHQHTEQIHKAYGNCQNCYGKGYATKQEFVSGGGKKWKTSGIKYCDCLRGEQLKQHTEQAVREARLDELRQLAEYEMLDSTLVYGRHGRSYIDRITHLTTNPKGEES